MTFIDVEAEEHVEHVNDNEEEEGMKDDRSTYGASIHGFILIYAHYFVDIEMSNFLLYSTYTQKLQFLKFSQCLH